MRVIKDTSVRNFTVELCERKEIAHFIEEHHYSKNVNGLISDYCFKLTKEGKLIGAMIYGRFAMAGVWSKYATSQEDVIELRRLCCIDDTPKNTESFFIGWTLRYLKRHTQIKTVISYADNEEGHIGTIYKASNFSKIGETSVGRVIYYQGRKYHDKTI